MYGFKKMKKRLYGVAFSHPYFRRDDEGMQGMIRRRKGMFKEEGKLEQCYSGDINKNGESGSREIQI